MYNVNSPIIQNMCGVPQNGTPPGSAFYQGQLPQTSISEQQEAIGMADMRQFSSYDYSPDSRFQRTFQQPQQMNFSGYGMISNPMMANQQSTPFGTLGYNSGLQSFNPSYNSGAFPQYGNYQPQYQEQTYSIPGFNPSGTDILISSDYEQRLQELAEMMKKEQEEYEEKMRSSGLFNSYSPYNYYGNMNTNMVSPYILSKYKKLKYELDEEASNARVDFNKNLSKIAHSYLNDETDDETINSIYSEQQYTIPADQVKMTANYYNLFSYTVPINQININNYNNCSNQITEQHNKIIKPDMNLKEFLDNAGELYALGLQEEVIHQSRDKSKDYNSNDSDFKRYLATQLQNRDGTIPPHLFPTLSNNSSILDDGTLNIKCPSWLGKSDKESEANYARDRQKFIDSIYNSSKL